jgi:stress responsive alpha/beta barrel protein
MIAHVVLFQPRPDLTPERRQGLVDALSAAATGIPAIARCVVGRRIRHGLLGYEQAMRQDYEFAMIVEVRDAAALRAYLAHPLHAQIGRHFTDSASAALAYDYETVPGTESARLIGESG